MSTQNNQSPELPRPNLEDLIPQNDQEVQFEYTPLDQIHKFSYFPPKDENNLSLYDPNQKIDPLKIKKICGIPKRIFLPPMYPKDVEHLRKYYNETGMIPQDVQEEAEKVRNETLYRGLLDKDSRKHLDKFLDDYKKEVYKMQQEGTQDQCKIDFLRYNFWNHLLGSNKKLEKYWKMMISWVIHTFVGACNFTEAGPQHSMWMDHLTRSLPEKYKQVFPSQVLKTIYSDSHL